MKKTPEVAVIISTHDRPEELQAAVENVLEQTYSDFAIIVTDNGVNPKTVKVAQEMQLADSRVTYINSSGEGSGPTFNRNFGIDQVSEDIPLVFILDDDDRFGDMYSLKALIAAVCRSSRKSRGDRPFAYGTQVVFGGIKGVNIYGRLSDPGLIADSFPRFPAKTMLFRTQFLRALGGFDSSYHDHCEDFGLGASALNLAKLRNLDVGFVDDGLVNYDASRCPTKEMLESGSADHQLQMRRRLRAEFLRFFGYSS